MEKASHRFSSHTFAASRVWHRTSLLKTMAWTLPSHAVFIQMPTKNFTCILTSFTQTITSGIDSVQASLAENQVLYLLKLLQLNYQHGYWGGNFYEIINLIWKKHLGAHRQRHEITIRHSKWSLAAWKVGWEYSGTKIDLLIRTIKNCNILILVCQLCPKAYDGFIMCIVAAVSYVPPLWHDV